MIGMICFLIFAGCIPLYIAYLLAPLAFYILGWLLAPVYVIFYFIAQMIKIAFLGLVLLIIQPINWLLSRAQSPKPRPAMLALPPGKNS